MIIDPMILNLPNSSFNKKCPNSTPIMTENWRSEIIYARGASKNAINVKK